MDANPFIEAYNTSAKAQYDQQYFQQHVSILILDVITNAYFLPTLRWLRFMITAGLASACWTGQGQCMQDPFAPFPGAGNAMHYCP